MELGPKISAECFSRIKAHRNFTFGVNQCTSSQVTSQTLAIFELILKIETSGLDKNSINLCSEYFSSFRVIKYIAGHVTGHEPIFIDRCQ